MRIQLRKIVVFFVHYKPEGGANIPRKKKQIKKSYIYKKKTKKLIFLTEYKFKNLQPKNP